jgi:Macrocin-O-methyltransferase (TylF)
MFTNAKIQSTVKRLVRKTINNLGYDIASLKTPKKAGPITKPTDTSFVEILSDASFQNSVTEVYDLTILDTARLANLWQLCRSSNPDGAIIEIGSFKGGSALHLSNSSPSRPIFVCDTFEGFGELSIDAHLDRLFSRNDFLKVDFAAVKSAWEGKGRNVTWVKGYFPESAANVNIRNISFAHIDVDLHKSTIDALEFLHPLFIDRSIIVLDDYLRSVEGVMKAVRHFQARHPEWVSFPMYPGQGLMVHSSWFSRGTNPSRSL